jgi:hypothetical protein
MGSAFDVDGHATISRVTCYYVSDEDRRAAVQVAPDDGGTWEWRMAQRAKQRAAERRAIDAALERMDERDAPAG